MLSKDLLQSRHNKSVNFLKPLAKVSESSSNYRKILKPIILESSPSPELKKNSRLGHRKLINSIDTLPSGLSQMTRNLNSRAGRSLERLAPLQKQLTLSSNGRLPQKTNTLPVSKIPSVVQSISHKSITGWINRKPKKVNQDSFFVSSNFNSSKSQTLLGVMDGHGVFGDQVSSFIRAYLPIFISKSTQDLRNPQTVKPDSTYPIEGRLQEDLIQKLTDSYHQMHNELWKKSNIDVNFSGSTAITTLIRGNQCFCSNCGDSRAVVGRFSKDGWVAVALSKDHKPEVPAERLRIEKAGGRIESYKDNEGRPLGPARVWLKNEQFPGLAMSRSIGDTVAVRAGIICTPDVLVYHFDPNDKFLVLASDGVWEFITNEECVQIISNFYFSGKLYEACEQLANIATFRWNREDGNVDDITVIIVSLKIKDE